MIGLQAHTLIVDVYILVRDVDIAFLSLRAARGNFRDAARARRRKLLRSARSYNTECQQEENDQTASPA